MIMEMIGSELLKVMENQLLEHEPEIQAMLISELQALSEKIQAFLDKHKKA
jgi:hypothetical protein